MTSVTQETPMSSRLRLNHIINRLYLTEHCNNMQLNCIMSNTSIEELPASLQGKFEVDCMSSIYLVILWVPKYLTSSSWWLFYWYVIFFYCKHFVRFLRRKWKFITLSTGCDKFWWFIFIFHHLLTILMSKLFGSLVLLIYRFFFISVIIHFFWLYILHSKDIQCGLGLYFLKHLL